MLTAAVLTGADLRGAKLADASMEHAQLANARLEGADLKGVRLAKADLRGADLRRAQLTAADLQGAQLDGANLEGANLIGARLEGTTLTDANLRHSNLNEARMVAVDLSQAALTGADLFQTDLSGAQLFQTDLSGARIARTRLTDAQLFGADLSGALLMNADLRRAQLSHARLWGTNLFANDLRGTALADLDLAGVIFEPPMKNVNALQSRLDELARARNLGLMTFFNDSRPLEELRRMLKRGDYGREHLEVTYAIRRGQRQRASAEGTLGERAASLLQLVLVELPIEYGAAPLRPVLIVFVLIVAFAAIYMVMLVWPSPYWGEIWRIRPREQFARRSGDSAVRERLQARSLRDLPIALWFSFLAALNIGGRIFNIDDLFINCQREEFYLRATGWARTLSGIQALITLYLFLLTLLIFFEKVTF